MFENEMYETQEMTPVQATYFLQLFDKRVGTDRELNDHPAANIQTRPMHYVFCFEMLESEIHLCRELENEALAIPEDAIQFDTGRFYDKNAKHIITAYSEGVSYDDISIYMDDCDLTSQWIIFIDPVRQIKGKIYCCALDQERIMAMYDRGGYQNV